VSAPAETPRDGYSRAEDVLTDAVEAEDETRIAEKSGWRSYVGRLFVSRDLVIFAVAVLMFAFFALANRKFVSVNNLTGILRTIPPIGYIAVGETLVFICGEIDLSVGANYGFVMTVVGTMVIQGNFDPWLASAIVVLLGTFVGLINGVLVTRVGLPSFIVTLGMLAILRGTANSITGGLNYSIPPDNTSPFFSLFGGTIPGTRIPNIFIFMLIFMSIAGWILAKTRFGSHVYATGGDEEAARNNGIDTRRIKLTCFVVTGFMCGLCGAIMFGKLGDTPVSAGSGFELLVIAAIIIGGVGLFGGRGTMFGSFVGTLILGMLSPGLTLIGVKNFWDGVAAGAVILVAAGTDVIGRRGGVAMLSRGET
jgi:ribose transport system permease protein